MSIKINLKLDKSYMLLTVMGLLLGYYAGFLFSRQIMTFLYNFMPMMEIRLIPTTIYSNLICMVLGAYISCAVYCILRKAGIKRQLFAAAAAFICVGLVAAAFSIHTGVFFNKLNNAVMDRADIQYTSVNAQGGINFWHDNSGNGIGNDIILKKGNDDLRELSKIVGRLKISRAYPNGQRRRDSDITVTMFCNYTISGEWFSRIISLGDSAAYSDSVKNYSYVTYDNTELKKFFNAMDIKYRGIDAVKTASWADYNMYEKAGYNLKQAEQEITGLDGLKKLLGQAPAYTPAKEEMARYEAFFADGIREKDGDMAVIELMNKGDTYDARTAVLYDRIGGIAVFGPQGPYIKADLSSFLIQKP